MSGVPAFVDEPVVDPKNLTEKELLIRLDGKLTAGLNLLFSGQSGHDQKLVDHEARIRALERARWVLVGIASVISIVASSIIQSILPLARP